MQVESGDSASQGKQLLVTMTGELFQPVKVYYRIHEDGITQLKLSLQSRQQIAVEHWSGNTGYDFRDYISKIVGK